ncbi:sodium/potassium/calcium exchanger 1-like [Liolophura sinensis]|uniref:sodium/potassium/calcium exchanger 1-like n=1 Tax=Liolophura sinensis TaxID=3198878 RepID=UPI00315922E8
MYILKLLFLGACFSGNHGKPTKNSESAEAGPCIGMDCLHGVLMHNDEKVGEDHKAEDSYIQMKEELATGGEEEKAGPCEGMDCLHGVLMHGDDEQGNKGHAEESIGPQKEEEPTEAKPEDPNEYFHGVLMHNGDEDEMKRERDAGDVVQMEIPQNPQSLDEYWHGVMMHNDSEPGKRHHDGPHDEDADSDAAGTSGEKVKPLSGDDLMHGVLMHGDEGNAGGHDHGEVEGEGQRGTEGKAKPLSGDDMMHGLLMHGEEDGVTDHADSEYEESHPKNVKAGPDTDSLHGVLMHGDEEHGVNHEDDHKRLSEEEEEEESVGEYGIDPESILHPEGYEDMDHKDIDLNKINSEDKDDFNEWQKEGKKSSDEEFEDLKSDWRETLGYITDGILSDIDLMKRRYLARFYTQEEEEEQEGEEPTAAEKLEAEWLNNADSNDMRHELNLIGDTGPIGETPHRHDNKKKEFKKIVF